MGTSLICQRWSQNGFTDQNIDSVHLFFFFLDDYDFRLTCVCVCPSNWREICDVFLTLQNGHVYTRCRVILRGNTTGRRFYQVSFALFKCNIHTFLQLKLVYIITCWQFIYTFIQIYIYIYYIFTLYIYIYIYVICYA